MTSKESFDEGASRLARFCEANMIPAPSVTVVDKSVWPFRECAYYRPEGTQKKGARHPAVNEGIVICVDRCTLPGRGWSWQGSISDRTPFGVLAHELGHHIDYVKSGNRWTGEFAKEVRKKSRERQLTGYCPNAGEWLAEMCRLFITNSSLLKVLRPNTYAALTDAGLVSVSRESWKEELGTPPRRIVNQLERQGLEM